MICILSLFFFLPFGSDHNGCFFNVFPLAGHNELFWDTKLLGKGMLVMVKCFFFMQCCAKAHRGGWHVDYTCV